MTLPPGPPWYHAIISAFYGAIWMLPSFVISGFAGNRLGKWMSLPNWGTTSLKVVFCIAFAILQLILFVRWEDRRRARSQRSTPSPRKAERSLEAGCFSEHIPGLFQRLEAHGITITDWEYHYRSFGCWEFKAHGNTKVFWFFWDPKDHLLHVESVVNGNNSRMEFIECLPGPPEEVVAFAERILLEKFSITVSSRSPNHTCCDDDAEK